MPNYTENLNLEQPLDSEQYDVGVTRRNNQKIDDFAETMPKLYTTTGQNTDGAMTQKASSDLLEGKVNKAGDTMTGGLYIERNSVCAFVGKNTAFNYTSTATPSANIGIGQFICKDVNDKNVGGISISHSTNNNVINIIYARRSIGGTEKNAYLTIGVDSSGDPYATAPATPTLSSNSTNIATTEFIKKYIQCGTFNIAPNAETIVNFSTAFPNQYIALAFARVSESTQTIGVTYPMIRALYTGSFRVYNPSSGSVTYTWIAVWRG